MDILGMLWNSVVGAVRLFTDSFPYVVTGLVVLLIAWYAGKLVGHVVCRVTRRTIREETLALALGNLSRFLTVLIGGLVASVVVFPSVRPADVLAFLGLGGVAVGFAFKDIFQNFFAGLLILFRRPFRLGDQIRTGELEGTVEDINLRATVIKTYDGERVIIPNGDVYTRPILVRTAYGLRRSSFLVGIGYPDGIDEAKRVILATLRDTEGVLEEPAPWVRTVELAGSSVNLQVYYWTRAFQADVLTVGDRVATGIKQSLDAAGIDMPYPVTRVLLSDGTTRTRGLHEAEPLESQRERRD